MAEGRGRKAGANWVFALLLFASLTHAQSPEPTPVPELGDIKVQSIHVSDVNSEGLTLSVEFSLLPTRSLTVETLRLSSLHINGVPLFAAPVTSSIDLTRGVPATLPPIKFQLLFRELKSVAPLSQMLEQETVQVRGEAQATVRVGFLAKLALHTEHPVVLLAINEDVPVIMKGPPLARRAAIVILRGVEAASSNVALAGNSLPGLEGGWTSTLVAQANGALFEVETSYAVIEAKVTYPMILDQLGFRLAGGPLLTTLEAKAPWEYEPEFLSRLHSGEARLDTKETDLRLVPVGASGSSLTASTPTLSHGGFTLLERGTAQEDTMLVDEKSMVSVRVKRRASAGAVLLLVTPAPATFGFAPAPESTLQQERWDKLAVFRLVAPTIGRAASGALAFEVLQLSGHREGAFIRLDQPVDAAAFGSPILTEQGVLGIVQEETSGAFLPHDLARPQAK